MQMSAHFTSLKVVVCLLQHISSWCIKLLIAFAVPEALQASCQGAPPFVATITLFVQLAVAYKPKQWAVAAAAATPQLINMLPAMLRAFSEVL